VVNRVAELLVSRHRVSSVEETAYCGAFVSAVWQCHM